MHRFAMILSLTAFAAFNYVQYQGWSVFSDSADAQPARSALAIGGVVIGAVSTRDDVRDCVERGWLPQRFQ